MINEELLEYGIVKSSDNGVAVVSLQENENCSECTARIFCKTDNSSNRELVVKDSKGTAPGTKVLISVSGGQILKASFLLYGIPLLLIMTGLIAGTFIFTSNSEIYSTIAGLLMAGIYLLLFSKAERNKERVISKIIYNQEEGYLSS